MNLIGLYQARSGFFRFLDSFHWKWPFLFWLKSEPCSLFKSKMMNTEWEFLMMLMFIQKKNMKIRKINRRNNDIFTCSYEHDFRRDVTHVGELFVKTRPTVFFLSKIFARKILRYITISFFCGKKYSPDPFIINKLNCYLQYKFQLF